MPQQPENDHLLNAGAARSPITPPTGFPVTGPEHGPVTSTGIDDDLLVRALFLSAGGATAAIVTLDVWGLSPPLRERIVAAVFNATGIPTEHVWLTCTGNGTSPATGSNAEEQDAYAGYAAYLPDICGGAVALARNQSRPAAIGVATASLPGVSTGVSSKGAEADSALQMAVVQGDGGEGIATIISFSCPATVRGPHGKWTADYPGYASWALEHAGDGTVLFARGADSDVRPYDWHRENNAPSHPGRVATDVQALGLLLATQASTAAKSMEFRRNVDIRSAEVPPAGIKILRVGPLVCVSIAAPQPAIFGRHLRRVMPRSTAIVSTNLDGAPLGEGEDLDIDLELTALEAARSAGAL